MIERELNSFFGKGQITGNRKNRLNYNFKDGYRLSVVVSDTAKPDQGIIIDKAQGQRKSRTRLDRRQFTTQSLMDRIKQLCYTGRNGPYSKMNNIGPKKEGVYEAINILENALLEAVEAMDSLDEANAVDSKGFRSARVALNKILGKPSSFDSSRTTLVYLFQERPLSTKKLKIKMDRDRKYSFSVSRSVMGKSKTLIGYAKNKGLSLKELVLKIREVQRKDGEINKDHNPLSNNSRGGLF